MQNKQPKVETIKPESVGATNTRQSLCQVLYSAKDTRRIPFRQTKICRDPLVKHWTNSLPSFKYGHSAKKAIRRDGANGVVATWQGSLPRVPLGKGSK